MYFQGSKSPSANIAPSLTQPLTLSALPAAVGSVLSSGLLLSFYFFKLISILFCTIECIENTATVVPQLCRVSHLAYAENNEFHLY